MFRYLTPREGTETVAPCQIQHTCLSSDTLLPVRGRKLRRNQRLIRSWLNRSDTLLPVRGRKPAFSFLLSIVFPFRYLTPREGTETHLPNEYVLMVSKFRYLTPREGTETNLLASLYSLELSSDTLLPVRGRKQKYALWVKKI